MRYVALTVIALLFSSLFVVNFADAGCGKARREARQARRASGCAGAAAACSGRAAACTGAAACSGVAYPARPPGWTEPVPAPKVEKK